MWLLAAFLFTVAGLLSRSARRTLGVLFWASLAVSLLTLYGMTL